MRNLCNLLLARGLYMEGMSFERIAERLGRSERTIRRRAVDPGGESWADARAQRREALAASGLGGVVDGQTLLEGLDRAVSKALCDVQKPRVVKDYDKRIVGDHLCTVSDLVKLLAARETLLGGPGREPPQGGSTRLTASKQAARESRSLATASRPATAGGPMQAIKDLERQLVDEVSKFPENELEEFIRKSRAESEEIRRALDAHSTSGAKGLGEVP